MKFVWMIYGLLMLSTCAFAQAHTPALTDPVRKAILDSLRKPVEKELRQSVKFKVDHFKVQGDWAFLRGVPQQPDGKPIDYRKTPYQQAIKDGVFDDWFCALLQKRKGVWQVVQYAIGATDVPWDGWDKQFKAPSSIFQSD
ncbi:MAG: hypothetical protein JST84_13060 [Acidobacteria bacterium]|nr:hypothetical protein [Acidobacteriota bacterium]